MDLATAIILPIGLSMDSLAVAIGDASRLTSVNDKKEVLVAAVKVATSFCIFQVLMSWIGWFGGSAVRDVVGGVDHWIAFLILGAVGAEMIHSGFSPNPVKKGGTTTRRLILLSIATSIDALVVGVGLALVDVPLALILFAIGIVTFALSFLGFLGGRRGVALLGAKVVAAGGFLLLLIGTRILLTHIYF